jgi:DNA primase
MIEAAASELLGLPFDEAEAETEFRATVDKLREGEQMQRFAELRMKAQQVGVAGLSAAEKLAYIEFVSSRGSRI